MAILWNNSTPVKDNNDKNQLDIWVPPDLHDLTYTPRKVKSDEVGRLDLISYRVYGSEQYFWVIATFNNILDPFNGFSAGDELWIPVLSQFLDRWAYVSKNQIGR